MWVIYFQGVAVYWLNAGQTYIVGRKDADLIILDDNSISRIHLHIKIELCHVEDPSRLPPTITLTDSSKYGTRLTLPPHHPDGGAPTHQNSQPLTKDVHQTLPTGTSTFEILLGTHGVSFLFVWEAMPIVVGGYRGDALSKLSLLLGRIGCHMVPADPSQDHEPGTQSASHHALRHAKAVVVPVVKPDALTLSALTAGLPLLSPTYFETILHRLSCKIPLPEMHSTSFCPSIDAQWEEWLLSSSSPNERAPSSLQLTPSLFLPRKERSFLFTALTFVVFDRTLFDDVKNCILFAQGHLVLDSLVEESLLHTTNSTAHNDWKNSILSPFFSRHHQHVLLYSQSMLQASSPFLRQAFDTLTGPLFEMVAVEYRELVRCVVYARRLALAEFPVFPRPRKTLLHLDRDDHDDEQQHVTAKKPRRDESTTVHHQGDASLWKMPRQKTSEDSLMRPDRSQQHPLEQGVVQPADAGPIVEEENLILTGPLVLPNYPCFFPADRTNHPSMLANGKKQFKKQSLIVVPPNAVVDFEEVKGPSNTMITSRIAAIDSDDIIPLKIDDAKPSHAIFNAFDVKLHNKRRTATSSKGTVHRDPVGQRKGVAAGPLAQALMAVEDVAQPAAVEVPPSVTSATHRKNVSIFDIDALY